MSFYLSKILWVIINPFNILLSFFLLSIFLNFINKRKLSYYISLITILLFLLFGVFPLGKYLNFNLEKNYQNQFIYPESLDGILILGGATNPTLSEEYNQVNLNGSSERLTQSIILIKKYPNAKIIFSGGSGSIKKNEFDHAKTAKKFFNQMGLNTKKIIFENKSRNTYENILFSKAIAKPKKNESWIVITSAFHMNRAIFIAEKNNWKLIPYAVDFTQSKVLNYYPNLKILNNLNKTQSSSHEWLGLIAYYFMGRIDRII